MSATKYYIWTIALSEWTGPGDPYTPFRIWYTPKLTNHDALWLLNATILSLLDQGVINYLVDSVEENSIYCYLIQWKKASINVDLYICKYHS